MDGMQAHSMINFIPRQAFSIAIQFKTAGARPLSMPTRWIRNFVMAIRIRSALFEIKIIGSMPYLANH